MSALAALLLSGCGSVLYAKTAPGIFKGKLTVEWIAPNQFIYRPDKDEPLQFTRSDGTVIKPQLMYTDGGSSHAFSVLHPTLALGTSLRPTSCTTGYFSNITARWTTGSDSMLT